MVRVRAMVLGRLGGGLPPPNQERVLYPAHRPLFTGRVPTARPALRVKATAVLALSGRGGAEVHYVVNFRECRNSTKLAVITTNTYPLW
jgi:hypothetical protein